MINIEVQDAKKDSIVQYIHKLDLDKKFNQKYIGKRGCGRTTIPDSGICRCDNSRVLWAKAKEYTWIDKFLRVSRRNIFRWVPKFILYFSQSTFQMSLWSSWRVTKIKQSRAPWHFKVKTLSSSKRNQILKRSKVWNPVVKQRVYSIRGFFFAELVPLQCNC